MLPACLWLGQGSLEGQRPWDLSGNSQRVCSVLVLESPEQSLPPDSAPSWAKYGSSLGAAAGFELVPAVQHMKHLYGGLILRHTPVNVLLRHTPLKFTTQEAEFVSNV